MLSVAVQLIACKDHPQNIERDVKHLLTRSLTDISIFVLKRDVKLQLTNSLTQSSQFTILDIQRVQERTC